MSVTGKSFIFLSIHCSIIQAAWTQTLMHRIPFSQWLVASRVEVKPTKNLAKKSALPLSNIVAVSTQEGCRTPTSSKYSNPSGVRVH